MIYYVIKKNEIHGDDSMTRQSFLSTNFNIKIMDRNLYEIFRKSGWFYDPVAGFFEMTFTPEEQKETDLVYTAYVQPVPSSNKEVYRELRNIILL